MKKPKGYWNIKENVFAEAKKYKTKWEFQKGCQSAYKAAKYNNLLDKMDWLVDGRLKLFTDKIDCVYRYYWEETNSVYVGRTIQTEVRDKHHLYDSSDTVYKHSKENNLAVPPMEIIEDNLTLEEGQEREDYWKNYYKSNGYNILNIGKTGKGVGSLGAIGKYKWDKEKVFAESKKYSTKGEFLKNNPTAYQISSKNGWLKEMTWLIDGRKINIQINGICSKPILQIDKKTNKIIAEFPSLAEIERQLGYFATSIVRCCKNKQKLSYGFKWQYKSVA